MIENFSNLYKSLTHKKMKNFNLKSKKLLTKDLHHFRLLGKYYFYFITSFN